MYLKQLALSGFLLTSVCSAAGVPGFEFAAGVKGGVPLTDPLADVTSLGVHTFSDSKNFIVGPTVELHLPLGFSVEGDGLYRLVNVNTQTSAGFVGSVVNSGDYGFWEVSVLGKYHLPLPIVKPYISAGPSFRTVSSLSPYFSTKGVSAALGVEVKALKIRIAPELRYTRWGSDLTTTNRYYQSHRDQAEFLIGITF